MPAIKLIVLIICLSAFTQQLGALPINFSRNQEPLDYQELKSDHFWIYFDKRTPQEGRAILNALDASKPILEHWLGEKRQRPLPVIMSSTTAHASFANFITDALELQTLGEGGRDLAWHELTHNIMYRHLANILGPTGSIIHLPWLPAWWIEGLAELSSRSSSSDWMFGVERYYALTDTWPSYDKLHNLYRSHFADVGYSISGSFTDYIVRTYGTEKLGQLMNDFYRYSMPWWWPWSVVPFADFMPWDAALRNYTGKSGEELYQEYKAAARAHWSQSNIGEFHQPKRYKRQTDLEEDLDPEETVILDAPGQSMISRGKTLDIEVRGNKAYRVLRSGKKLFEYEIIFTEDGAPPKSDKRLWELPSDSTSIRASLGTLKIGVNFLFDNDLERSSQIWAFNEQARDHHTVIERPVRIQRVFISKTHVLWLETEFEYQRLCQIPLKSFLQFDVKKTKEHIQCPIERRFPAQLSFLGQHYEEIDAERFVTSEIFLNYGEETLIGDRSKIIRWLTHEGQAKELANPLGGKVISIGKHQKGYDLLIAGKSRRFIRQLSLDEQCLRQRKFANLAVDLQTQSDGTLIKTNWFEGIYTRKITPNVLQEEACHLADQPLSPLQYALSSGSHDLDEALRYSHPWQSTPQEFTLAHARKLQAAPLLHLHAQGATTSQPQDANWRGRPVFAFPWIGADAKGYQFGAISVPLMDHMQNETLRFSALYGLESRFPNTELNFVSNRFRTTYAVDVFRRQSWNGAYRGDIYYYDERGAKISAYRYFYGQRLSLRLGLKMSDLRPYIGPSDIWNRLYKGYHQEIDFSISQGHRLPAGSLGYYLLGVIAPEEINDNIIYDRLGLGVNYYLPINLFGLQSSQKYGIAYSRTRGKQQKLLREVYRPLKTFVPGSGGGFNEINISMLGPGALTSAVYGDTQARFEFAWNFPVIRDLETLLHIFYLERLDFTAFFNYGRAWYGAETPDLSQFVKAHGYNLDLQSDIKGVTVNLGLGTGQVIGQDFEVYFLFGFDALIDP
ncbi:MAG: hypothetical protein ACOH5I_16590 [Oligoflexus sp.]